jgi:hypothetical protein
MFNVGGNFNLKCGSMNKDDRRHIVPHADRFTSKIVHGAEQRNDDQRQDQAVFDGGRASAIAR